jgi:hypothetical protein
MLLDIRVCSLVRYSIGIELKVWKVIVESRTPPETIELGSFIILCSGVLVGYNFISGSPAAGMVRKGQSVVRVLAAHVGPSESPRRRGWGQDRLGGSRGASRRAEDPDCKAENLRLQWIKRSLQQEFDHF